VLHTLPVDIVYRMAAIYTTDNGDLGEFGLKIVQLIGGFRPVV